MTVDGLLGLNTHIIVGVDPGSRCTGICLMRNNGLPKKSWTVRYSGAPLERLKFIAGGIHRVFAEIKKSIPKRDIEVVIEEGMFRSMPKVCAMIGEVRGVVMAEAWRLGWSVKKVYPMSWKTILSKTERGMKKDSAYVTYWNKNLEWDAQSSDEVDAILIGIHGARK